MTASGHTRPNLSWQPARVPGKRCAAILQPLRVHPLSIKRTAIAGLLHDAEAPVFVRERNVGLHHLECATVASSIFVDAISSLVVVQLIIAFAAMSDAIQHLAKVVVRLVMQARTQLV